MHHLIFLPDTAKAEQLQEAFAPYSTNLSADGRPRLHMNGAEIADLVLEAGGLLGPAHAFTPWTGIFAYYRSLAECYQEKAEQIGSLSWAFLRTPIMRTGLPSSPPGHFSPTPMLIRRAPTSWPGSSTRWSWRISAIRISVLAIKREGGRRPTLNVGLFPEEGKYNRTACTRCYRQYSRCQKDELMGRCPECGGQIKLGVADRVNLLADYEKPVHPTHRPPYLHIIPLAEIIALALGHKSAMTAGVQKRWSELTEERTEIEVLMQADLAELKAEPRVIEAIQDFRLGRVEVLPGGGGKYGEVRLAGPLRAEGQAGLCGAEPKGAEQKGAGQRSLFDF